MISNKKSIISIISIFGHLAYVILISIVVIAAASVDDVLAISGFTILLGITFKPHQDLLTIIFQGPKEAVIGLLFGVGWGILVILLPGIQFWTFFEEKEFRVGSS